MGRSCITVLNKDTGGTRSVHYLLPGACGGPPCWREANTGYLSRGRLPHALTTTEGPGKDHVYQMWKTDHLPSGLMFLIGGEANVVSAN